MGKKKSTVITAMALSFLCVAAVYGAAKMMSVQVKKGAVRSNPGFMGGVVANLSYGDRVETLEEKGAWTRIAIPGGKGEGWIHGSALTKKKIVLKAGADDVRQAASSDELALAGKGFNQQVEKEFKSRNPNVDYAWIDKMETFRVSQSRMRQFVRQGNLSPEGGGA